MPTMLSPREAKVPTPKRGFSAFQVALLIICALAAQRVLQRPDLALNIPESYHANYVAATTTTQQQQTQQYHSGLAVPVGGTVNLPSVRVTVEEEKNVDDERKIYGGKGDKAHLGGFTELDIAGISPAVWKHVVSNWTVQSVMDVGCGRGISTSWFVTHGVRTECVEGSHDAMLQSIVPDKSILTEHDFSRGPWWPSSTFDMVWSVEFLEHVNLQFHPNYVATFRKAAILLVTSSRWGGWHHVEVHPDEWWIRKYEAYGFRFDQVLTDQLRKVAVEESRGRRIFPATGKPYNAQHVRTSIKVFINPAVAALPEHAHLFGEFGCFRAFEKGTIYNRECGKPTRQQEKKTAEKETPLDPAFYPLVLTEQQDQDWYDIVEANVHLSGDDK